jgi:hypothetical protein
MELSMSEFHSVHHQFEDQAPMAVRVFNRLVLIMAAGLTLAVAAAISSH